MPVEIRNYLQGFDDRVAALRAARELDETSFGEPINDDDLDSPIYEVLDDDRTFVAWDGDQTVGMGANFTLNTSTPGGSLPTAGVTFIAVRPTHRRRGVMTQMLDTLHADGIARGEPIAALWAADAAIYGRFGYGLATQRLTVEIPHAKGALLNAPEDPSLRLRMVDTASDYEHVAPIYEALRKSRGGVLGLDERWNARHVYDPAHHRDGGTRAMTVLVEDDDRVRGYLRYALKASWPSGRYAEGSVTIYRLMSLDAAAHAALWRYCLSIDLMTQTKWWNLPVDDPIVTWLEHSRQTSLQVSDAMWVRILDLPAALTGRTYSREIDVVLEVTDKAFEQNAGTWRLSGGPDGATCERTNGPPDLTVDVRSLGAVLLGGPTLQSHSDAGWLEEHTAGSVSATSDAFTAIRAPYCPFVF
jgi:predicted acetyltransferase